MRALLSRADVVDTCAGDPLIMWAAQGLRPGVRVWSNRGAVAAACPDVIRRNRLAVYGPVGPAASLVRDVLRELGAGYRLIGDAALVDALAGGEPRWRILEYCWWMDAVHLTPIGGVNRPAQRWLGTDEHDEVQRFLATVFPTSTAQPGVPGVQRWAGYRDVAGNLVTVAADAWTAPGVGFVAGVATAPRARRQGHAALVCRFALENLIAEQGRVALIVDEGNTTAVRLYERLGLARRAIAVAALAVHTRDG